MPEIGVYEAKTHFARLLERVQQGERFVITKHGRPIAELSAVAERDGKSIRLAIERLRRGRDALARKGVRLGDLLEKGESLREFMHRGHRF